MGTATVRVWRHMAHQTPTANPSAYPYSVSSDRTTGFELCFITVMRAGQNGSQSSGQDVSGTARKWNKISAGNSKSYAKYSRLSMNQVPYNEHPDRPRKVGNAGKATKAAKAEAKVKPKKKSPGPRALNLRNSRHSLSFEIILEHYNPLQRWMGGIHSPVCCEHSSDKKASRRQNQYLNTISTHMWLIFVQSVRHTVEITHH